MLKFYKNHLRRRQKKVLFVQLGGIFEKDDELKAIINQLTAIRQGTDLTIVATDLKEGASSFSLL